MKLFKKMVVLATAAGMLSSSVELSAQDSNGYYVDNNGTYVDNSGYCYDNSTTSSFLAPGIALGAIAIAAIVAVAVSNSGSGHHHSH